jgi:hypothetical protein
MDAVLGLQGLSFSHPNISIREWSTTKKRLGKVKL